MIDKFVDWLDDFVGKKINTLEKEQPVVVEDKTKKKKKKPVTARKLEVGESRDLKKKGKDKGKKGRSHYPKAIKERAGEFFADGHSVPQVIEMLKEEFGKSVPVGTINNWRHYFRKHLVEINSEVVEEQMVMEEIPVSGKTKAEPDNIAVKEQAINLVILKTDDELLDLWKEEKIANKNCPICWHGETTLVATTRDNDQVSHRSELYIDEHLMCDNCSAKWVVTYRFYSYEIKD